MKKIMTCILLTGYCFGIITSCNTATPENYFDRAVLNCNMLTGFAGEGLSRELESPSVKLVKGTTDQSEPMKRKEIIDTKITVVEEDFEKVKKLPVTDDIKEMLQSSVALYEYVLPVYKNEYTKLAELYDTGASKDEINSLTGHIHDTYFAQFEKSFKQLMAIGKPYAARHNIQVHWPE